MLLPLPPAWMQTTKVALEARCRRWLNHGMERGWVPEKPLGGKLPANPNGHFGPYILKKYTWPCLSYCTHVGLFFIAAGVTFIIQQSHTETSVRVSENFIDIFGGLIPGYKYWFVLEYLLVSPSITSPWLLGLTLPGAWSSQEKHAWWHFCKPGEGKHKPLGPAWMSTCELNPQTLCVKSSEMS